VSLLGWLFPVRVRGPEHLRETLRAWHALPDSAPRTPLHSTRFVVVDTETSGLDPRNAKLLSIGACAIEGMALCLDPCFERTIRQDSPTEDANILVHGLGRQLQTTGDPQADALAAFLTFAGKPVLVGYHALFDAMVLQRPLKAELGVELRMAWLDVAVLLPALLRTPERAGWELDRWLRHFGLDNFARHSALADAFATAQLLLIALARAGQRGVRDVRGLFALQRAQLQRGVVADGGVPAG
jgi:DNA polymerase-3 subunit epsilon